MKFPWEIALAGLVWLMTLSGCEEKSSQSDVVLSKVVGRDIAQQCLPPESHTLASIERREEIILESLELAERNGLKVDFFQSAEPEGTVALAISKDNSVLASYSIDGDRVTHDSGSLIDEMLPVSRDDLLLKIKKAAISREQR